MEALCPQAGRATDNGSWAMSSGKSQYRLERGAWDSTEALLGLLGRYVADVRELLQRSVAAGWR